MNNVSLIGRLTADPELRHTQSGLANTRFTIAVDRRFTRQGEERQADFINIVAFQQTAEFVCKYFGKGKRIALTGRIQTGSYTDRDGNKRYTTDVIAENVEFCDSKSDSNSGNGGYQNNGYQNNNYQQNSYQQSSRQQPVPVSPSYSNGDAGEFNDMPTDEDLPF